MKISKPSIDGGLAFLLLRATQAWRAEAAMALQPWALTVPQFLVIVDLYRVTRKNLPAPQQVELGNQLAMDANTTSQIVRALEERGLLSRAKHPVDRRARILELTADGLELAKESSAVVRRTNDRFFGQGPEEETQLLADILSALVACSVERTSPQPKGTAQ